MTIDEFEWTGDAADHANVLAAVAASDSYTVDGTSFSIPTRQDYEHSLRAAGLLADDEPLQKHAELVSAAQAHWHAGGHNACRFAVELSATRAESGWRTYVIGAGGTTADPNSLADAITARMTPCVAEADVEVVSFILPNLDDPVSLASLIRRLGSLPNWSLDERPSQVLAEFGRVVPIGLRAELELDHWGEILGFGRLPGQGNTRLAPFTELAIRAKEPPRPRPRNKRAYMADIYMGLEQIEMGQWWHETERDRTARLGAEQDALAKARVTFVFEEAVWKRTTDE